MGLPDKIMDAQMSLNFNNTFFSMWPKYCLIYIYIPKNLYEYIFMKFTLNLASCIIQDMLNLTTTFPSPTPCLPSSSQLFPLETGLEKGTIQSCQVGIAIQASFPEEMRPN